MPNETVLITGGSSGIGLELARQFAAAGSDLVLISENGPALQQAREDLLADYPHVHIVIHEQDLCLPDGPAKVWAFTKQANIQVDVLVNNAGFGTFGYLSEQDIKVEADMIRLNVMAVHQLTLLFLPQLRASPKGGIINISSISAYQPVPLMATYAATKAFVLNFSRALRFELREQGCQIPVLAVCPTGTARTGFMSRAGMEGNPLFKNWMTVMPALVASASYRAFRKNKETIIPGRGFNWLNHLVRRLPSTWVIYYARTVFGR